MKCDGAAEVLKTSRIHFVCNSRSITSFFDANLQPIPCRLSPYSYGLMEMLGFGATVRIARIRKMVVGIG